MTEPTFTALSPSSPSRSFAGWDWRTYLRKTKTGIKWIFAALVTYLGVVILPVEPPELRNLLASVIGYASKVGFDVIDYYLTDGPQ